MMTDKNILSDPEKRRYARQMLLPHVGLQGQENLKSSKVAVVGIGGIGSFVIQYLAAIGVGHIGIIDFNLIDETNIQRQILYGGSDLGKLKSIAGKQLVQEMFPFNTYEIINLQLTEKNTLRILKPFQIVIDATNDYKSGIILAEACSELEIPVVRGSVFNFTGSVAVIEKNSAFRYVEYLKSGMNISRNDSEGASAVACGFVASVLAMEIQKILTEYPESLISRVLKVDLLNCTISKSFLSDLQNQKIGDVV